MFLAHRERQVRALSGRSPTVARSIAAGVCDGEGRLKEAVASGCGGGLSETQSAN